MFVAVTSLTVWTMPGPYDGIRVIELGRFIAAPYCGQLLADGGADVIKVEPLNGDDARRNGTRLSATEARQFLNKNRSKRSIALDLRNPGVQQALQQLAANSDIIIANFRPGQGAKLGLDYPTLTRSNPGLIYAENSAFGLSGPLAGKPGMDALLQGYAAVAHTTREGPQILGDPIVDYTAAMLMAWGIASALFARERTGKGQKLDVSLLQAALVIQNNSINHIDAVDGWRHEFVDWVKDAFARGASFDEVLSHRDTLKPAIVPPYYGFFRTADGLMALGAGGRGLQIKVAELLGIEDPSHTDSSFVPDDIAAHTQAMHAAAQSELLQKTTAQWLEIFDEADLPASPVNMKDQVLDDEQAWANEYLTRLEHETVGSITVVAPPVKFSATPLAVRWAPPTLGKHTREILNDAGLSSSEIEQLIEAGAVIDGSAGRD